MRASKTYRNDHAVSARRLNGGPLVESVVVAVAAEVGGFVLESTDPEHPQGRYSIVGFDPIDAYQIDSADDREWLKGLSERIGRGDERYRDPSLPLVGGWVGFAGYEAGPALETAGRTTPSDLSLPAVHFALYDTLAIFDHHADCWSIAAADIPGRSQAPRTSRLLGMEDWLRTVKQAAPIDWSQPVGSNPEPVTSREDYLRRVRIAKDYIEAGDIYQVNLTQRFTAQARASAMDIYRRLRISNPAPLSAFLTYGQSSILSASPELFLSLDGRNVTTRPIKGTRPRVGDAVLDAVRRQDLMASEKDCAELTMIVDLLRNDLGRVSEYSTVKVVSDGDLESHPTVMHRVATITSQLRRSENWASLLRASFPGGSVTGCPKIRATQIIDELETTERSVYCGSIGFIGLDGSMCLNIAIRTMVLDRGEIHMFGGGAIVADSDAADEYDESLAKMAGMMHALSTGCPSENAPMIHEQRTA